MKCIKEFSPSELTKWFQANNEPAYRIKQLNQWLYAKPVKEFNLMTNLSLELRQKLTAGFLLYSLELIKKETSQSDNTEKYLLKTADDQHIESVIMPYPDRCTICVSTQVGCRYGCKFCASGANGFTRNLTPAEIIDQITIAKQFGHQITHIVFMGMGEPLDNLPNLLSAIKVINSPDGFNIGARRITVSTAGLPDGIMRLSQAGLQIELSISLHSANDAVRSRLMPINKRFPVEALIEICRRYIQKTSRQITFEYILIDRVNNSDKDAEALGKLLKGLKCQLNLIAFNPHSWTHYSEPLRAPSAEDIIRFQERLFKLGIHTTMRQSRGQDISAACGQLSAQYNTSK
jgi:23S rRNA (adenine2503-C2)-methyltransferase